MNPRLAVDEISVGERERELGRKLSELARWAQDAGFEYVELEPVMRHGGDEPAGAQLRISVDRRGVQVLVTAATGL
jgi:sugar phosphate isomerase/epimerase